MMDNELVGEYFACASGAVGYELLDLNGEIFAWTVDGWWVFGDS